ncbi:DUF6957 family protein [Shewanella acanthi]|uniref:DUF6957 family protein n=1 Tax=Shewanella acanthi TaxID=2864212 RepID=UPI001C65D890|nr:hypothetical protein [Shewanella acanthi]QYJ80480.1 hypothetical protein K0H61_09010 [Shewanella acanthi]
MPEILILQNIMHKELFSLAGSLTPYGCQMEDIEQMKLHCRSINPSKALCVVKDWIILVKHVEQSGTEDTPLDKLVLATNVIEDEKGRFPPGGWVRTSWCMNIHHDAIFETGNTFYILVGNGNCKHLYPEEFLARMKLLRDLV